MAAVQTQEAAQSAPYALLSHHPLNQGATSTILFIHGAFGDCKDWDLVVPYIREYHLLLPDCPGHGRSSHLSFSIERSAKHIAHLIEAKAISSEAHIVGHSLGAPIAVRLAVNYPHLVRSGFVSEYRHTSSSPTPLLPQLFWTMNRVENAVPRPLVRWLMDGTDMRRTPGPSLSHCVDIARSESTALWPEPWPAHTLVIVAGKGGVIPSNDGPEDARKLSEIGQKGNGETVVQTQPLMRHPWNRQDPFLWATTVMAWVEGRELPAGFVPL